MDARKFSSKLPRQSAKFQHPNSKEVPTIKQNATDGSKIEALSFSGCWSLGFGASTSAARHHFEQDAFEIFCFWQSGQHRMIRRLLKAAKPARRPPRVHQRIGDHQGERV